MSLKRQIVRPHTPTEQIAEALPIERAVPLDTLVIQTEESPFEVTLQETYELLKSESDAWKELESAFATNTQIPETPTSSITISALSLALATEDPRYPDYTEKWQGQAFQEGSFSDMMAQILLDVRNELTNSIQDWDVITKQNSEQAVKAHVNLTQVQTSKSKQLRSRVLTEMDRAGEKVAENFLSKTLETVRYNNTGLTDELSRIKKTARALREILKLGIILRTAPYTKQWRSLTDLMGYSATRMLISKVSPMLSNMETRLCAPLYDVIEGMAEIAAESYSGSFDAMLDAVVSDLEKAKAKVVATQEAALQQLLERYDKRESIVQTVSDRVELKKSERVIDGLLEMIERVSSLAYLEMEAQRWLKSQLPGVSH